MTAAARRSVRRVLAAFASAASLGATVPLIGAPGAGVPLIGALGAAAPRVAAFAMAFAAGPAFAAEEPGATRTRESLPPLTRPLWSELGARQREILAPLERQWNTLPATAKRSWMKLADRVPKMRGADREKAERRIREWATLSRDQRKVARNNYRLTQKLDRNEVVANWEQYQSMTPEQQAVLRASGTTSNTAARHAGAPTGLAKEAARPLPRARVAPKRKAGGGAPPGPK